MVQSLRFSIAQLNPTVGALEGNMALVRAAYDKAVAQGADVLVTSELIVTGYPPEDLVCKPAFQQAVEAAVHDFLPVTKDHGTAVLLGSPWVLDGALYNAVLVIEQGALVDVVVKQHLPTYGVFDEMRLFAKGDAARPVQVKGHALGVMICEDMWFPDVTAQLKAQGAEALVVLNGSPFEAYKTHTRLDLARARVAATGLPLIYSNQIGGQDELVFDGGSFVLNAQGQSIAQFPDWQAAQDVVSFAAQGPQAVLSEGLEALYQAMICGLRDYVTKNGFKGVLLGLSGGIDSALSAAVAVDALGADRVRCVMMPSPYTSQDSLEDAQACADYLGVAYDTIGIGPAMAAFSTMLAPAFAGESADITEENIQSRSRGLLLMALSNKFGSMLLTTGNKSEMAVGYATIYGDMCGGYSVLKDLYKMTVFAVSRWRNDHKPAGALGPDGLVMPDRVITKPPSAELRPDQKDEDSLPPYEVLDDILECLIEKEYALEDVVALGHDPETVRRIWRLLDRSNHKRYQAPPGVKVSSRAFGRDRRYPLTNGFTSLI